MLEEVSAADGDVRPPGESAPKVTAQSLVLLDRYDPCDSVREQRGQNSRARSDLVDDVASSQSGSFDQPSKSCRSRKKVLGPPECRIAVRCHGVASSRIGMQKPHGIAMRPCGAQTRVDAVATC